MHVVLLTGVAMLAFAANSLLCRLALAERLIDPASFTAVRVTAGAAMLSLVMLPRWRERRPAPPDWRSVALLVALVFAARAHASWAGIVLAVMSGAVASAMGYAVWYTALRHLTRSAAATVQLSVPVIAAIGGVLLLSEAVTLRLVVASIATLGGVALVISQRHANR